MLGTAAAAGVALLPTRLYDALAIFAVAGSTGWIRQRLMPAINTASDAAQLGDAAARGRFACGHRLSVGSNFAQMLTGAAVLVRFVV